MEIAGSPSPSPQGERLALRALDVRGIHALAVLAVLTVMTLVAALGITVNQIDNTARKRDTWRVGQDFAAIADNRARTLGSAANWDDALQNLGNRFSERWAQGNLVSSVPQDPIGQVVLVLDDAGRVIFARERARPIAPARSEALRAAIAPLVAHLRAREPAVPYPVRPADERTIADWVLGSETVLWQGRPTLISAGLVGPDAGLVRQEKPWAPILVYAGDVEHFVLPALASRLLLADPALRTGDVPPREGYFWLADIDGRRVAHLQWTPVRYGMNLLLSASPAIGAVVLLLLAAVVMAYRQGVLGTRALIASEARASYAMLHDPTTGLPNRATLRERLDEALARQPGQVALLVLDIDRFRIVNNLHGFSMGNEVLTTLADRLRNACGPDDMCLRAGADEFMILSLGRDSREVTALVETLLAEIRAPIAIGALSLRVTACIGACLQPADHPDAADLQHHAEIALYAAKEAGAGEYRLFASRMDEALHSREQLEADLRRAVAEGTINVLYQPQYAGDRLVGVEALARWAHPDQGEIPPGAFVPIAETGGMIGELGRLVLRRAFADSRRWPSLMVAVNVSPAQLLMPGFVELVTGCILETGADPRRIELEITETLLLADTAQMRGVLFALRAAGFKLVLDDFGTGYSSLSYLHKFPIDKIKIDRSFVSRVPADVAATSVVQAIVRLAQALKMDVTAEGVESAEQRRAVTLLGCRLVQGFLTGAAMTVSEIDVLLDPAAARREAIRPGVVSA